MPANLQQLREDAHSSLIQPIVNRTLRAHTSMPDMGAVPIPHNPFGHILRLQASLDARRYCILGWAGKRVVGPATSVLGCWNIAVAIPVGDVATSRVSASSDRDEGLLRVQRGVQQQHQQAASDNPPVPRPIVHGPGVTGSRGSFCRLFAS
jgi:hypothetical protein